MLSHWHEDHIPITQRQNIEIEMKGAIVHLSIDDRDETERKQAADLDQDQLADVIEALMLCQRSRSRRKVK